MSNYMSIPNQQILWNTVNRIPAFMQLPLPKRELEFKNITEYFYREHMANTPILSTIQLQELNRKTILAFLPPSPVNSTRPPLPPSTLSPPVSESNIVETRQEKQERAFLERQNMYAQMTEKPNLPSPEIFKEKETDEKITNMDELIASYQKQRNLEIPIIPPPTPTPSSIPSIPSAKKKNITFLEETEINSLEIQDLSTEGMSAEGMSAEGVLNENTEKKNLASLESSERKNLAWNVNLEETRVIEDSYLQELEKRLAYLEKQIQFLSEIKNERKPEIERQEKEIQTISEVEVEVEVKMERTEIEEIIESVILSIEQQV